MSQRDLLDFVQGFGIRGRDLEAFALNEKRKGTGQDLQDSHDLQEGFQ